MWNYRSEVIFNTYFQHVNILKRFICIISRVWMLYLYVCTCTTCVWRSEEGIGHLGSTVIGDCGPLCGFWEPNPTPLQEQQVLLTSKPSLQILMICSSLYLHYYEINILLFFEGLATQAFSKPKKDHRVARGQALSPSCSAQECQACQCGMHIKAYLSWY